MNKVVEIIIIYFIILLLLFSICNAFGASIFKLLKFKSNNHNFYLTIFRNSSLGASLLVVITSIFYANGKTINLVFLLIGALLLFEKKMFYKNNLNDSPSNTSQLLREKYSMKNIIHACIFILIVYIIQITIVINFKSFEFNNFAKDSFYYAELSKCLIHTGQENTFATYNLISSKYHFPTPYHYFDMWLNGFIANIFNLNYSISLYLITYSFFTCSFLFGLIGCFEHYGLDKYKYKILAILLLFIGGLNISENQFHVYSYCSQMEGLLERYGNKLNAIYCFALGVMAVFIIDKNRRTALIILLSLPIVSISLAPGIYIGTIIYSLYNILTNKDKGFHARLIIYVFMLISFIGLFYYLNKINDLNYRLDKNIFSYTDLTEFTFHKIKFYIVELFLKSYQIPFLFLTNYFPFVLIVIWILLKKLDFKNYKSFILLFSLIILAGLISRSTLYLMDDAYQLYTNTLSLWHVLSVLSIILLLSRLNTTNVKYKWITVIFILSTLAFNCYSSLLSYSKDDVNDLKFSKKYVIEVNNECEKLKENVNGATFYDSVFFKNTAIQYPYEYYCMPPILSSKLYPPYNLTSMDRVQSINSYQLEKTVKKSVYNQYLSELTKGKSFKDSIDNQINFIKTNQIKYLICPRSMKTDFKKYLSIKTEIYDSISGQRFITFN